MAVPSSPPAGDGVGAGLVSRPELFKLLDEAAPMTVVSAPAGSGKTLLLRSWIASAGLQGRVASVSVERDEQDAQRFWFSVIRELRAVIGGEPSGLSLEPTPDFDAEAGVERLTSALEPLEDPILLLIDDLHEIRSPDILGQIELLLTRRPASLRVVVASRRDPRLGLHRLRLSGELTEIRNADLRFTLEETRELLAVSGVSLSEPSVARLHERTEGWAAALRLAAISLAGHPEPDRFVAEFSGSERTVADYLLAEVLERQPEDVRRLLLRTALLDRVNAELADLLAGGSGSERILQALEEQNAFVTSLDASRSWYRYHPLFADLLRLELRRTEPESVPDLHRTAAGWYTDHGDVIEAVRHLQAAEDWAPAAHLLADHSFSLWLDGRGATVYALLGVFPATVVSGDPELARLAAAGEVWRGSLREAEAHLADAERTAPEVPAESRPRFEIRLGLTRLMLARRRGDPDAALEAAETLLAAEAPTAGGVALGDDVRASALMHLGIVEMWSTRPEQAERHLEGALELARLQERPYLEVQCLGHLAVAAGRHSMRKARERALEAIAIAEAHGWEAERITGPALVVLGNVDVWQGRFDEAEHWLQRAEKAVRPELEPRLGLLLRVAQGRLHAARGRREEEVGSFRAAAQLEALFVAPQPMMVSARRLLAVTQAQLGDTAEARATLSDLNEEERASDTGRLALAFADLADGDAEAAVADLAPLLDGSVRSPPMLLVSALLLDASARDALGEPQTAESDIERALELAEPDGLIWPFVVTPARDLVKRHTRHSTAHGGLLKDILDVLAGARPSVRAGASVELAEELSEGELKVLRYLPSNLSMPEIGRELYLSVHTVKTHARHIYAKLGVHRRSEAVERARELGLLAPSSRSR